jgi:lysophospholipid acyltransferase
VFSFAYLTWRHLTRAAGVTANNVDDAALQMVLVCKLYSLAYNVYDGMVDKPRLLAQMERLGDDEKSGKIRDALQERLRRAVPAVPSPLEYAGFVLNFATAFVGPSFEIGEYLRAQRRGRADAPPVPRWAPAAAALATGAACLGANIALQPRFPVASLYALALDARAAPLWWRGLSAHVAMLLLRVQYYGVWKVAEGAAIVAGYGYRPQAAATPAAPAPAAGATERQQRRGDWAGVCNVNPLAVETSTSTQSVMRNWNIMTQQWLELYIFRRAPRVWGLNRWLTYGASAFWHGFYAGYYLGFLTIPFQQEVAVKLYAIWRPRLGPSASRGRLVRALYPVAKWASVFLLLDYALGAFSLLDWHRGVAFWQAWGYAGHLVPAALLVLSLAVQLLWPVRRHGHHAKGRQGEHPDVQRSGNEVAAGGDRTAGTDYRPGMQSKGPASSPSASSVASSVTARSSASR